MATAESASLEAAEIESSGEESYVPVEDKTTGPSTGRSLLDVLKPATPSDLARKRKIEKPKGPGKKRRSSIANPRIFHPLIVSRSFLVSALKLGVGNCFVWHAVRNCH